jgi:sulfur-oxidizing protein SoxY
MEQKEKGPELTRRGFITSTGAACAMLLMAGSLPSLVRQAFAAPKQENINDVLKKRFGDRKVSMSHVDIEAPIIAENGAVVPVTITSDLPMRSDDYVKKINVYAEGNLDPYVAGIDLTPANGKAEFAMRIKMRKTANVRVVLETSRGKLYSASKSVKVTIGGCGG